MKTLKFGLSQFHLIIIAVVLMLVGVSAEIFKNFEFLPLTWMGVIGLLAAPIFMFVLINYFRNSSNKSKMISLMYLSNLAIGILLFIFNLIFETSLQFGFLGVLLYVIIYIFLVQKIIDNIKNLKKLLIYIALTVAVTVVPIVVYFVYDSVAKFIIGDVVLINQVRFLLSSIVPNVASFGVTSTINIVGTPFLFIVMGVAWYFFNNRFAQGGTLVLFSIISYFGAILDISFLSCFEPYNRYFMAFALPFILLYSGKMGFGLFSQKYKLVKEQ